MNIVSVKFKGLGSSYTSQDYAYLTDLDLKVGDEVVVESPSNGMTVVSVTKINGGANPEKASKWIVCKVDKTSYIKRQEEQRRKAVIETKLKAIERQMEAETKYSYLAQINPEAAALLAELRAL